MKKDDKIGKYKKLSLRFYLLGGVLFREWFVESHSADSSRARDNCTVPVMETCSFHNIP